MHNKPVAVVTGASSGIGAETVRLLCENGYLVFMGARRLDRLQALAEKYSAIPIVLDVSSAESVHRFTEELPDSVQVLVNNAGGALGLEQVAEFDEAHWLEMYQSNVLGLARMTKALYPRLLSRPNPVSHVFNIGSVASFETYPGGAGYTACKHAVRAISETMRLEWLGKPIRVTEIDPGFVETEFSLVRFGGDVARASSVYAGMVPLTATDIAETILWSISRPPHVNIDVMVVRPLDQARIDKIHREA
ncbi:SDR family NAD(P)-dependent oxidoreductase [Acidithiobacillus sp. AMEEHan]|uniref:SDR family NAD(P)-dependent oxidoreductase n=1 Tax=Acidithiobacillus sp. AMEEHan TaxID=2994951 RepID=UPI0027E3B4A8|nr:SDR family NAD(P)-dependent oxidoreductase [Acidithiobacillus sp. AMEEHan]